MKKLSLDLQSLTVESFETHVPRERQGTVHAAESPSDPCSWPSHCGTCIDCSADSWCVCDPDYGTNTCVSYGQFSCVYTCQAGC